jgi:hypothetical protein
VASTSFILPLILNICVIEHQNVYAQLGISPGEIIFNKTNNNDTDITKDKSSDDQIAVNVLTPMPGVNSTLIGRSTPTTGNLSIEASNNTGGSSR